MMNDRFLWKEGDLEFSKSDREPTQEELDRVDKAIEEVIEYFRKKRMIK